MNLNPTHLRRHLVVASVAVLSLGVAACGDDSGNSATKTVAPTVAPAASPTTADSMMDHLAPSGPGCAAVPNSGMGSFDGMAHDPAATAASHNPLLSTLVSAVTTAGLVDTLNGAGPFTIFAPTNDAFAAVPKDQLTKLLADKNMLTSVLTYHVVAGSKMSSADLIHAGTVTTVNGAKLTITEKNGTLLVNGVATVCMDVPTANATVHIISGVLLP